MAKIYKFFQGKFNESWHQLSSEEQNSLMTRVSSALDEVGGKRIIICDSSWSSEQWPFFGLEEFPGIEAVQRHAALLNELNWSRYLEARSLIGTEWQSPS